MSIIRLISLDACQFFQQEQCWTFVPSHLPHIMHPVLPLSSVFWSSAAIPMEVFPVHKTLHSFKHLCSPLLDFLLSFPCPSMHTLPLPNTLSLSAAGEDSLKIFRGWSQVCQSLYQMLLINFHTLLLPLQKNLNISHFVDPVFRRLLLAHQVRTAETSKLALDTVMLKSFSGFWPHTCTWGDS